MFLRTADGNSVSTATKSATATATGSTIEGGQMSSKVKTQLTKVNKLFARKLFFLILFSVQVNRVDTNNRSKL